MGDRDYVMFCHCGDDLHYGYDGNLTHHRGMCKHCDAARCDAFPGDCGRPSVRWSCGHDHTNGPVATGETIWGGAPIFCDPRQPVGGGTYIIAPPGTFKDEETPS